MEKSVKPTNRTEPLITPVNETVPETEIEQQFMPPPSYEGLSYREVIICNGFFDSNLKAFPSYESYTMFKDASRFWKTDEHFQRVKYNQNLTKGIPLMLCKRVWNVGIGETKYLKLLECATTPHEKDRLYNKTDNRFVATVFRRRYLRYTRFRLSFAESEVIMFYHHLLEIMDFEFNGERFRFFKTDLNRAHLNHFAYDLFRLPNGQVSLVDEMDANRKISKKSPLLGGRLRYVLGMRLCGLTDCELMSPHLWGKFQTCKRDAIFTRTTKTCTLSLFSPVPADLNMNSSVDKRSYVLTAITMILKSFEFDLMIQNTPVMPTFNPGVGLTLYAPL